MSTDENDTAEDSSASPRTQSVDVVVVGAGTSGCYAAATIANAGYDVTIVERKPEEEAGHIACGDALKGADAFPEAIPKSKIEPAFTNTEVDHGRFEIPQEDTVLDIPVPGELAVIDRWEYGRLIIEGAEEAGADLHYDTVVQDVKQDDDGTVTGIVAKHDGEVVEYDADIVIDGAGSLSLLQDKVDFSDATFDTNVSYQHFSSAYREVVEVPEPVEWSDALVFKPAEVAAGYVWYFPRTETEINAGLGFQMTEEPMKLVDDLKRDLRERPEFEGAEVIDKLGAALPTRRPYDSATAPGYMAVGDAAAHVNPTTGGGIAGAAYAGKYAGEQAAIALDAGDVSEELLWRYNQRVMDHFGGRYASLDVYNILSTAVDVDDLMGLIASIPGEKLAEALYSGTTSFGPVLLAQTAASSYGHWSRIYEFFKIKRLADELLAHYGRYPSRPSALEGWQVERDRIMDDIYELTGADPKY
ncbi:geranylgeranyl reductase family protein [Haloferax volcanii]|uniref:p-hydroxybenzoate hydroxylase n=3 Tax=Haloferax volcanii TaxID=2246 RepID=A0A384L6C2_HALVD|nr:geranylgeranyl reductase family protein [Haloferax volcanii]ADE04843.1 FAD-dependent oxidoreductase [Haloferax volcanii DS2]ELY28366.1 P-hydroxybenzoate hydroxylase [Haloferax volcanii DS2]MBS8117835.1 geranylgeranyl reductase family protein [Haloferax volcanii]MBS8122847.1 geranylgeranyl reductase family protein [Haloferax volcanii]MBS8126715.1 geranylgeranyl reductase family protein [Haloferax volcanii]